MGRRAGAADGGTSLPQRDRLAAEWARRVEDGGAEWRREARDVAESEAPGGRSGESPAGLAVIHSRCLPGRAGLGGCPGRTLPTTAAGPAPLPDLGSMRPVLCLPALEHLRGSRSNPRVPKRSLRDPTPKSAYF